MTSVDSLLLDLVEERRCYGRRKPDHEEHSAGFLVRFGRTWARDGQEQYQPRFR